MMWTIISGILGILGFVISLVNIIHRFVTCRVNLEIVIKNYSVRGYVNGNDRITIHYQANNKSQLPISITDMRIIVNGDFYSEDRYNHEVLSYSRQRNGITEFHPTYNGHLPIVLGTLSSKSDYLVFVIPRDSVQNHESSLNFEVRTNRNKQVIQKFVLNEPVIIRSTLPLLRN